MGTTNLRLTGFVYIVTEETQPTPYDTAVAELRTLGGELIESLRQWSNLDPTTGWVPFLATSTSPHAGETVRLALRVHCDQTLNTNFFFDTLALIAVVNTPVSATSWGSIKALYR